MEQYNQQQHNPTFLRDLVFSIIQLIFVPCLYGLIPMIITIVANGAWKKGDYVSYEKHTKTAFVFLVIGWVLLGIFAFVVLGGFAYLFYSMVTSGF